MASFSALGTEGQRTCGGTVPQTMSYTLALGTCRSMLHVCIRAPFLGTVKFLVTANPETLPVSASIETALREVLAPRHIAWNRLTAPRTFLRMFSLFLVDE